MNTKQLKAWEKSRDLEAELLASIDHIENSQFEELNAVEIPYPTAVRIKLGLSQSEFSRLLNIPKRTIQEWEQNRRKPTGAALTLLKIVENAPDTVKKILVHNQGPVLRDTAASI